MRSPEHGGVRTQRAVVALCSPVCELMPEPPAASLSVSLSLFGVDSAAACWISACSSFPLPPRDMKIKVPETPSIQQQMEGFLTPAHTHHPTALQLLE